ncbi:MAG TPA: hypothetical protein PKJ16_03790 [Spirochaetota bacterium]|nr:hypothetical protein [Spirochaetota bacterium]HOS41335.1 hypothetical protein [Spirochaetota bacterium]HPU90064.1 hypothetical protein [Spirochaetota bacterium]
MSRAVFTRAGGALLALFIFVSFTACGRITDAVGADDPCPGIRARFDAVLERASGACVQSNECGCYGAITEKAGCGGVTDKGTADQLGAIAMEFNAAKCAYSRRCAPWLCAPKCVNGRCVRR